MRQFQTSKSNKHFRIEGIMCHLVTRKLEKCLQASTMLVEKCCSPINFSSCSSFTTSLGSTSSKETKESNSTDYQPSLSDLEEIEEAHISQEKELALKITNRFISKNPKFYVGICESWFWLVDELHQRCGLSVNNIKLTLMKIRLNDSFNRLGDQFGLCRAGASKAFRVCVPTLAEILKTCIYFPNKNTCKKLLPISFRANFGKLYAITDAFEIQIEKPSDDPEEQALTWSDYKQCNTLKYLICIAPDGLISFISKGFGGRISDTLLFNESGIMNDLPEKSIIMADRGFKSVDATLSKKQCMFYRPPTVSSTVRSSVEDVILTKRIASLRIHVERSIRRIREYSLLTPHATLHHSIIPMIDNVVIIAAALTNLQGPLIKT